MLNVDTINNLHICTLFDHRTGSCSKLILGDFSHEDFIKTSEERTRLNWATDVIVQRHPRKHAPSDDSLQRSALLFIVYFQYIAMTKHVRGPINWLSSNQKKKKNSERAALIHVPH